MGTLHCALENGADLYVNERQKIRSYRTRSAEERRRRRMPNHEFLLRTVRTQLTLYSDVIYLFDWKSVFEHNGGLK